MTKSSCNVILCRLPRVPLPLPSASLRRLNRCVHGLQKYARRKASAKSIRSTERVRSTAEAYESLNAEHFALLRKSAVGKLTFVLLQHHDSTRSVTPAKRGRCPLEQNAFPPEVDILRSARGPGVDEGGLA